ncbi:MAG TPA: hypothetical protein VKZ74_06280 [Natronosporangium sp.]|nr:hypothetical protein [Natronosporangium sp.]
MTHQPAGLHDHVATLLDAMGTDPVAVASTLRAEEIHGIRGSVLVHPVCRWLIRLVPDLGAVLGRDTVNVFRPGRGRAIHGAVVPLPDAVRAFADRFDDGEHPELELSMLPRPITPSETATPAGEADPPASTAPGSALPVGPDEGEAAEPAGPAPSAEAAVAEPVSAGPAKPERPEEAASPAPPESAVPVEPTGSRVPAQATAPTTPTGSTGPTAPTGPAGSKKTKRPRKPTRPREPKETTVSSRPAGTSATTDRSPERHLGSGGPASGAEAAEAVSPPRPTGTARTATGPIPPRNLLTDTVRLVAVRG